MGPEAASRTLAPLLASPKAIGLELTIYDPDLDPDGVYGARLVRTVEAAFADSGRFVLPTDQPRRDAAAGGRR